MRDEKFPIAADDDEIDFEEHIEDETEEDGHVEWTGFI
jgi:hypothetical protein